MTIEVEIIADSVSPVGNRLTTFQLVYPRFVHAELMTHRVFSRNASSSRAIPVAKIIQQVIDDPAMPVYWGKNQRGMQAKAELNAEEIAEAKRIWLVARDKAVEQARELVKIDLHKQIANRILEPWHHINVVVTATDFDNFFALRCHPDAQPEIKVVADKMRDLYYVHQPKMINYGAWHLPYVDHAELGMLLLDTLLRDKKEEDYWEIAKKLSTARCARVSHMTHDNQHPDMAKDVILHDQLLSSKHMSPFEHQGTPMPDGYGRSGNFNGWIQHRKTIADENTTNYQRPQ